MVVISIFVLAVGLAMDALAAAIAQGACGRPDRLSALRIGAAFGTAQALMPILGWGLGLAFAPVIAAADHWVALALLGFLGLRMIVAGLGGGDDRQARQLVGWTLLATAIATSIDAAAAGLTLPLLGAPLLVACAVIGVVTGLLSFAGVYVGAAAGVRMGRAAEIAGGLLLVGLGVKIFIAHQFGG